MKNKVTLSKLEAEKFRKYCKGCRYFDPELPIRNICNIISWLNRSSVQEVMEYVKKCPCNKKCIVKVSCTEKKCPIWIEYVSNIMKERRPESCLKKSKASPAHSA